MRWLNESVTIKIIFCSLLQYIQIIFFVLANMMTHFQIFCLAWARFDRCLYTTCLEAYATYFVHILKCTWTFQGFVEVWDLFFQSLWNLHQCLFMAVKMILYCASQTLLYKRLTHFIQVYYQYTHKTWINKQTLFIVDCYVF